MGAEVCSGAIVSSRSCDFSFRYEPLVPAISHINKYLRLEAAAEFRRHLRRRHLLLVVYRLYTQLAGLIEANRINFLRVGI